MDREPKTAAAETRFRAFTASFMAALQRIRSRSDFRRAGVRRRRRAIRLASDACLADAAVSAGSVWARFLDYQVRRRRVCSCRPRASSIAGLMRRRRRRLPRRALPSCKEKSEDARIKTLRRLVPGGHKMAVEALLREAADYVVGLKMQVRAMGDLVRLSAYASGVS